MKIFKLPDLGEGLPDAEIREWLIKEGDNVSADTPVVAMETAKAVVDVPAPRSGMISKFHGKPGDVITTGAPLFEYIDGKDEAATHDSGTVVGNIEVGDVVIAESATGIKPAQQTSNTIKATPAVRQIAAKFNIDLTQVTATGVNDSITVDDIQQAMTIANITIPSACTELPQGYTPLRGVRRAMAQSMFESQQQIVPVTILDQADIQQWPKDSDITLRVIRAIVSACRAEPSLNALFDAASMSRKLVETINLGIAMDSDEGLFVPVIADIANMSATEQRATIQRYKTEVQQRDIAADKLSGHTITLSNFGMFAGRFANPIIVPPTVCIIGTGKIFPTCVAESGQAIAHRTLPLSLTFDHRAVTGGEATRFMAAIIADLSLKS